MLRWLFEQRSTSAGIAACVLLANTAILRYGFHVWWPWGIVMATVCAIYAIAGASTE